MKNAKLNSAIRATYGTGKAARVIATLHLEDGLDHNDYAIVPADMCAFRLSVSHKYEAADVLKLYREARVDAREALTVKCKDGSVRLAVDGNNQAIPRTYNEASYVKAFILPALVEATAHDVTGTPLPYDEARFKGHRITWSYVPGMRIEGGEARKKPRTTKRRGGHKA